RAHRFGKHADQQFRQNALTFPGPENKKRGEAMRGVKPLVGAMTALFALTPLAGVAAELPAKTAASASAAAPDPNADCGVYGSKFFKLSDSGFCGKAGYDVMAFVAKD